LDPRSVVRKKLIPDPNQGIKKAPNPGSTAEIDMDPQHWLQLILKPGNGLLFRASSRRPALILALRMDPHHTKWLNQCALYRDVKKITLDAGFSAMITYWSWQKIAPVRA
jgi:hypothetical protein